MSFPLLAAVADLGDLVLRVLAIAGGALVGGLGLGLLSQLVARFTVTRPLPKPALNLLRALGAITLGLVVYFWAFGPGGPGFGLGGGFGFGGGGGKRTPGEGTDKETGSRKESRPRGEDPTTGDAVIRIEVLGDPPKDGKSFYRVEGERERLTMEQVRELVRERRKRDSPPLEKLVIVLYDDSPDRSKQQIRELEDLALDLKLRSPIDKMEGKAPKSP
jgi:hypothetical protein